jgi:hypothetical protein
MDLSGTFDSTNALSGMFLWVMFGFLVAIINCDLQRFIKQNPAFFHIVGLTAFFFLFTLLDTKNNIGIQFILIKTVFVYFLFVLMTKSKWYFVIPVLILLLTDQLIKKNLAFVEQRAEDPKEKIEKLRARQQKITYILNITIIVLIFVGASHYMILQKIEYKDKFSFWKFLFGISQCKPYMPRYEKML